MTQRVPKAVIRQYQDPDEFAYFNMNDQDLQPFRVDLPKIKQPIETITNYGLPASEQVFIREKYPMKLMTLEKEIREKVRRISKLSANEKELEVSRRFWDTLYVQFSKYEKELEWIKWQWYYRLYGKWYFINGKPIYLDGFHFMYQNYWHLEQVGKPSYRERDRKWFIGQRYFMNTQQAPLLDKNGSFMYHPYDGTLVMEDVGYKTFSGSNDLKARQIGDTSKAALILADITMRTVEGRGGIQAEDEDQSEFVFRRKVKLPISKMSLIFKPTIKEIVNLSSGKSIDFSSKDSDYGIDASIDYATTVSRTFYDGENINVMLVDEAGKLSSRESVKARHEVIKKCVRVLHGFLMYCTTVYELDTSAGDEYLKLVTQSHIQHRNENKKTTSELGTMFFSSDEAYEGFIGKFGEPIKETPPRPDQIPYMKNVATNAKGDIMGAREYQESIRRGYEKIEDMEGLANEKRMEPLCFRDCFTPPAKNQWFDYEIISNTMSQLQLHPLDHVKRGNFMWVGNRFSNEVTFREDPNGRWIVSERLLFAEANRIIQRGGVYYPDNGLKFICATDVFRAVKAEGGKMSNGGMSVYIPWDKTIDDPAVKKDTNQYKTRRFVCTYLARPSVAEFVEDSLKTCIYFGAMQWPENNLASVEERYKEWGYGGYLLYGYDKKTGRPNNASGWYTNTNTKEEMFNRGRDWVKMHGRSCEHEEILKEYNTIKGPDDLSNHDLLASALGCFLAEDVLLDVKKTKERMQTYDLEDIKPMYYY